MRDEARHYEHRFHAGNVGDVWKHVALVALLSAEALRGTRVLVDLYAGAGRYPLGPTGEWTEGIGRLLGHDLARAPLPVARYLELATAAGAARERERSYPGSPLLLRALAPAPARVHAFEVDDGAFASLSRALAGDPSATARRVDGWIGVEDVLAPGEAPVSMVLVDPPYADRREWQAVPRSLLALHGRHPGARLLLWYPVKSYARPNAMLAELERAGLAAVAIELITAPLDSRKNRLSGSGVLLVDAPEGTVEALAGIAAWLGPRLSAQGTHFTVRVVGLSGTRAVA